MISTAIMPAISAGLQLANFAAGKMKEAGDINTYIDRAARVHELFDPKTRDEAYRQLFAEMQTLCAKRGITPTVYYEGAPCLNIPLATLVELMDAATAR